MDNSEWLLRQAETLPNPKALKRRDRAASEMEYSEYVKRFGDPPTPLFKPQCSPIDQLEEIEMPPSQAEDNMSSRRILSCPTDLKSVFEDNEEDEDDESQEISVSSQKESTILQIQAEIESFQKPSQSILKKHEVLEHVALEGARRFRSQSENIIGGRIFKFMESTKILQKGIN